MKLISWNVNGIRAVLGKGFHEFLSEHDPDILCIQETKAHPDQVNLELDGYHHFWNSAVKKGYSGTAIFSKIKPLQVTYGVGKEEHDNEGRVIVAEFPDYFLVTVYTPNAKRELLRLPYRTQWDRDFLVFIKNLEQKKPVIVCGDLNVAHTEIDLARPADNRRNPGFTDEEREGFSNIVMAGFIDTFREFNTDEGHYSWWSYMQDARAKNIGWRIDYFCISQNLRPYLEHAFILPDVMGSDHCPVGMVLR
ncbi:MAG: exodeoxyribonuclease III [bacterium]|nr:exodeoxyribonuclease III [bacterium]